LNIEPLMRFITADSETGEVVIKKEDNDEVD
jgi:hypothetical protein